MTKDKKQVDKKEELADLIRKTGYSVTVHDDRVTSKDILNSIVILISIAIIAFVITNS